MPHASKTAHISTRGYYPPRGLSMEPEEEEPQEQEFDSPTPIPMPEPVQEEPEEVKVIQLSDDDDEEDVVEEDEPISPLGWMTKVWYKPGCESSVSHHRLMSMLQTYYGDWDAAVKYVCEEHTHPLEDTYWKTRVCISIKDEQKGAYQLDSNYAHHAHYATMEDSIEEQPLQLA